MAESGPFIEELLNGLHETVKDLEMHQIYEFYEAVGILIHAEGDEHQQNKYIKMLMRPPNDTWAFVLQQVAGDPQVLEQQTVVQQLNNVLRTNIAACKTIGAAFRQQIEIIFRGLLQIYQHYSEIVSKTVAERGEVAARQSSVKQMRAVKRHTLKLL